MIACELLEGGDLLSFIRGNAAADRPPIRVDDCVAALTSVAEALKYLHACRIVHRDVAARNVLVGTGLRDIRVSDLGLARRIAAGKEYYEKHSDDKIPVKWMPIEAISHKKYTAASDVWSFGVLMWEVFSGGQSPWATHSAVETVLAVAGGHRLQTPAGSPRGVKSLLQACWAALPEERPSLAKAIKALQAMYASVEPEDVLGGRRQGAARMSTASANSFAITTNHNALDSSASSRGSYAVVSALRCSTPETSLSRMSSRASSTDSIRAPRWSSSAASGNRFAGPSTQSSRSSTRSTSREMPLPPLTAAIDGDCVATPPPPREYLDLNPNEIVPTRLVAATNRRRSSLAAAGEFDPALPQGPATPHARVLASLGPAKRRASYMQSVIDEHTSSG